MAFARIRSLRNSRRRTPSPAAAPPNPADDPVVNKTPEASNTIAVEETEEYHNTQDETDAAPIQGLLTIRRRHRFASHLSDPLFRATAVRARGCLAVGAECGSCGDISANP